MITYEGNTAEERSARTRQGRQEIAILFLKDAHGWTLSVVPYSGVVHRDSPPPPFPPPSRSDRRMRAAKDRFSRRWLSGASA